MASFSDHDSATLEALLPAANDDVAVYRHLTDANIRATIHTKIQQLSALLEVISDEGLMVFRRRSQETQDNYFALLLEIAQDCVDLGDYLHAQNIPDPPSCSSDTQSV